VLDTSTLLWWTLAPQKLSKKAVRALEGTETIIISSISFWEIGIKTKRKLIDLGKPIATFFETVETLERVVIHDVSLKIWLASLDLKWDHKDPADRVIVATAQHLEAQLVSPDAEIKSFFRGSVW